jgi:hypothetical protein
VESAHVVPVAARVSLSAEDRELFPLDPVSYKILLADLHQCFCGKKASEGVTLSRCANCKGTYYCSAMHQKTAWQSAPYMHRTFCQQMQNLLRQGFPAIVEYMKAFRADNVQNIHPSQALEGWSIACSALERELFSSAYEESKLLMWSGTCHVMMSGQHLKEQQQPGFELATLLQCFGPGINLFV